MLAAMAQFSLFDYQPVVWSVSDLNRHIRVLLESEPEIQDLWVAGEVSNLSRPASGHLYFTLKDPRASLRCVMWRSDVARQRHIPAEGQAVEVHGRIGLYEAGGLYQLYADLIRPAGEGALYQAFVRLKARLEAEGLFEAERKRPLPAWPRRIGVVTSPTGAALQDVLNVLRRRFPLAEVILAPTPVQGEEAPAGIVAALETLNRQVRPDLILLVRGGGSIEDLWAFNDERVARAVAASQAPVVTGVGHEVDFTIADFAADVRAPTPSAAAELATPDVATITASLRQLRSRLARALGEQVLDRRMALEGVVASLRVASPRARISDGRQRLDALTRRAAASVKHGLALRREALNRLTQTLQAVGPPAVLARGYALVTRQADGTLVRSVAQVSTGDRIRVRLHDGSFGAQVKPPADDG